MEQIKIEIILKNISQKKSNNKKVQKFLNKKKYLKKGQKTREKNI